MRAEQVISLNKILVSTVYMSDVIIRIIMFYSFTVNNSVLHPEIMEW